MGRGYVFLHIVHMTAYNSMNEKQPRFPLILFEHAQTHCIYVCISTKIPPHTHHTPLYTHKILHATILPHTHIYNIPTRTHHKPLHTHTIIHMKILTRQSVTHTRKYYSYKKLTQYPNLPETHHVMQHINM